MLIVLVSECYSSFVLIPILEYYSYSRLNLEFKIVAVRMTYDDVKIKNSIKQIKNDLIVI